MQMDVNELNKNRKLPFTEFTKILAHYHIAFAVKLVRQIIFSKSFPCSFVSIMSGGSNYFSK